MDPVTTVCRVCHGRRYRPEVLGYTVRGASIADVLDMTASEALGFWRGRDRILTPLRALCDVGLGYLTLGRSLSSLSGGERQRLKLADHLHRRGGVYVLDEPTTGLHMADVDTLMALLDRLVDGGNTVIVIEHDLEVVERADWVIDLGPEAASTVPRSFSRGRRATSSPIGGRSPRITCAAISPPRPDDLQPKPHAPAEGARHSAEAGPSSRTGTPRRLPDSWWSGSNARTTWSARPEPADDARRVRLTESGARPAERDDGYAPPTRTGRLKGASMLCHSPGTPVCRSSGTPVVGPRPRRPRW
ncbi:ATP-binding cassette domain-containing protein [Nocardia sp. bgisy134]|uniref:ATP-binding cassette domain-containing protein n=1 Tax=Nocardia sp. bgisy134 TaxID=3413789 RepID=UPI003D71D90A